MLSVSSAPSCFFVFSNLQPLFINQLSDKPVCEERTRRMDTLVAGRVVGAAHPAATTQLPPSCHHPPRWAEQISVLRQRSLSSPGMRPGPLVCLLHHLLRWFFFFFLGKKKIDRHLDFTIDTKQLWGFK